MKNRNEHFSSKYIGACTLFEDSIPVSLSAEKLTAQSLSKHTICPTLRKGKVGQFYGRTEGNSVLNAFILRRLAFGVASPDPGIGSPAGATYRYA